MLDTLICLLQEESERIGGKALPEELCRKILIEHGGMVSPTAWGVREAQKTWDKRTWPDSRQVVLDYPPEEDYRCGSEWQNYLGCMIWWRGEEMNGEWEHYYTLHDYKPPEWVRHEVNERGWRAARPLWPYVSREARLEGIMRGDFPEPNIQTWTRFVKIAQHRRYNSNYYILGAYRGPCPRCQAQCSLEIDDLGGWWGPRVPTVKVVCVNGHEHQQWLGLPKGITAFQKLRDPVRAYVSTLGIELVDRVSMELAGLGSN